MSERRLRVLVVDDDPAILSLVSEALRDEGYDVDAAIHGEEALTRVRERRPDAILVDLMIPVLDGWSFVRSYRAEAGRAAAPIVVMSAASRISDPTQQLPRQGVLAYLAKPFDLDTLLSVLERVTGNSSSPQG